MKALELEDLIYLHDEILKSSGGLSGVRDRHSLEAALSRPHQSLFGKEVYGSLFHKAAALLHSIALNHGFNDGNKRTAMAAASLFLYLNSYQLTFTD